MFHWCCEHVIWDSEKNCYKITYCISTYTPNIHPQKLISPRWFSGEKITFSSLSRLDVRPFSPSDIFELNSSFKLSQLGKKYSTYSYIIPYHVNIYLCINWLHDLMKHHHIFPHPKKKHQNLTVTSSGPPLPTSPDLVWHQRQRVVKQKEVAAFWWRLMSWWWDVRKICGDFFMDPKPIASKERLYI